MMLQSFDPRKIIFLLLLLPLLEIIFAVTATTHWLVTENGKIQPQNQTMFHMHQPQNLLTFLNQETTKETASLIHEELLARKTAIGRRLRMLEDVIGRLGELYSTDPNCLMASKPLSDVDLYATAVLDGRSIIGLKREDYVLEDVQDDVEEKIPDCKETFPLDFSIYTFEHLKAMQNREKLAQKPETHLLGYLSSSLDQSNFGNQIALGLLRNKTSWVYLNSAAIYWRIKGDAYNALECSRRAIVTAPWRYRAVPLLTTGGILHAAKQSLEAFTVLNTVYVYKGVHAYHLLTMGHINAVLGNFEHAVVHYDYGLKIMPSLEEAMEAKLAILCLQMERSKILLMSQQLRDIESELLTYRNQIMELSKIHNHMLQKQTLRSAVTKSIREVEEHTKFLESIEERMHNYKETLENWFSRAVKVT